MIILPNGDDLNGALSYMFFTMPSYYWSMITVKNSSSYRTVPTNVFNYNVTGNSLEDNFATEYKEDQWVSVHLVNQKMIVSHFTLKSTTFNDWNRPRNFALEGSNDDANWDVLRQITNTDSLLDCGKVKTFKANTRKSYRYFRIRQTGQSSTGTFHLVLNKIDLFGNICSLNERCSFVMQCTKCRKTKSVCAVLILLTLAIS